MKNLIKLFALSICIASLASCSQNDSNSNPSLTTFTATLNGTNEVPSNSSTATGSATLTFNNTTKMFSISVNHTIAAATAGHIHMGAAGTNGSVVFPFSSFTSPISYTTSVALTAAQESDLKANLYYVNLHSSAFSSGEIRGQLIKGTTTSGGGGGY